MESWANKLGLLWRCHFQSTCSLTVVQLKYHFISFHFISSLYISGNFHRFLIYWMDPRRLLKYFRFASFDWGGITQNCTKHKNFKKFDANWNFYFETHKIRWRVPPVAHLLLHLIYCTVTKLRRLAILNWIGPSDSKSDDEIEWQNKTTKICLYQNPLMKWDSD